MNYHLKKSKVKVEENKVTEMLEKLGWVWDNLIDEDGYDTNNRDDLLISDIYNELCDIDNQRIKMMKYENGLDYMSEKLKLEGIWKVFDNERIDGWLDELKKLMIQLEELPNPDTNQIETYDGIYWDIVNLDFIRKS